MSAVVGVDGETGIVADKAAGHLDGIESARLQLSQKLAVESQNVLNVAKEGGSLFWRDGRPRSFIPPVMQVTLPT